MITMIVLGLIIFFGLGFFLGLFGWLFRIFRNFDYRRFDFSVRIVIHWYFRDQCCRTNRELAYQRFF